MKKKKKINNWTKTIFKNYIYTYNKWKKKNDKKSKKNIKYQKKKLKFEITLKKILNCEFIVPVYWLYKIKST